MKRNLLSVFILLFATVTSKAQIYADSVISSSGVVASKKAVNKNDSDYATMSTLIGIQYQSKLKLGFDPDGMGEMVCFIKVQPVDGILSANLLQSLSVSCIALLEKRWLNTTDLLLADAELLSGAENTYLISVTSDKDANISSVEITLSGTASILYKLRIYEAHLSFPCQGSNADSLLNYNHVLNAENAVSASNDDYALMSPNLSGSSFLSVHFNDVNTNRIRYLLGKEGIIDVQLLSNIQLTVYGKNNEIIASQNGFTLAEADILANNKFYLSLKIPHGSNQITKAKIIFTGYGAQLSTLQVYRITAHNTSVQVKPYITPDKNISFCGNDSVKLTAHPPYNGQNVSWQWYRNNDPIADAINKVYYAKEKGEYFVTVTSDDNCKNISDEVEVIKENCTSDNKTGNNSNSLQVYPNPFIGSVKLQMNNITSGIVTVTDKSGKVIETFKATSNQSIVMLTSANPGIYFIKLTTAEGKTYTAKAIKQ